MILKIKNALANPHLIKHQVASALVNVLERLPNENMPAHIGTALVTLTRPKSKDEKEPSQAVTLQDAIDRLKGSKTDIGRAVQQELEESDAD